MLQVHIEETVLPKIDAKAHFMAAEIDSFLRWLIPGETPRANHQHVFADIKSTTLGAEQHAIESEFISNPTLNSDTKWTKDLAAIFRKALVLRAECEMAGGYELEFSFPSFGMPPATWRADGFQELGDLAEDENTKVLLTLMPNLWARFSPFITGPGNGESQRRPIYGGQTIIESLPTVQSY